MKRHHQLSEEQTVSPSSKKAKIGRSDEKMHRSNIYKYNAPDFALLAEKYPSFRKYVYQKRSAQQQETESGSAESATTAVGIDYTDPRAVLELTKVLLHHDFNLQWDQPVHHLCPPVTNRANYIHWINDLLSWLAIDDSPRPIRGIDIGTGASCIYPLLGVRIYDWSFLATDVDRESVEWANRNVTSNNLCDRIDVRFNDDENRLLDGVLIDDDGDFDFCMCNPPFFGSEDEIGGNPNTVCMATSSELITEGGEVGFISKMIADSLKFRTRIKWYTSMIGKKSSLKPLRDELRKQGVLNVYTTEFSQGRTMRWGIAWTFCKLRTSFDYDTDSQQQQQQQQQQQTADAVVSNSSKISREGLKRNVKIPIAYESLASLYSDLIGALTTNQNRSTAAAQPANNEHLRCWYTITKRDTVGSKITGRLHLQSNVTADCKSDATFSVQLLQARPGYFMIELKYFPSPAMTRSSSELPEEFAVLHHVIRSFATRQ